MSTVLLHPSYRETKRGRIVPLNRVSAYTRQNIIPMTATEGRCELNTVFEDVVHAYADRFDDKYLSITSDGVYWVRMSTTTLRRVIELIFDGMISVGLWRDGEAGSVSPVICACLNGYGAVLELTDEETSLPANFLAQFTNKDPVRPANLPGRQLLMARDLVERHGGRLSVHSSIWEHKAPTCIRLFLPRI